jgi:hypothetical protein
MNVLTLESVCLRLQEFEDIIQLIVGGSGMITSRPVAYRIEWRSYQERRWIPAIACSYHVQVMSEEIPVRMSGGICPVEECILCKAVKQEKERLKLQRKPPQSSPIADGIPPSQRLLKA